MSLEARHALAVAIAERERRLRSRLAIGAICSLVLQVFVGWPFALFWLGSYVGVQSIERICFWRSSDGSELSPAKAILALGFVALSSFIIASGGFAVALAGGRWGAVCAGLHCGSILFNSAWRGGSSRAYVFATGIPQLAVILCLPALALFSSATPIEVMALLVSVAQAIFMGLLAWRASSKLLKSEQSAREAAEAATIAKSAFVATVSHELRTPMTAILAGASLIRGKLAPAEQGQADLIVEAGAMMRNLLNDLLDLSKIEAGKLTIEVVDYDARKVLVDTLSFWRAEADRKGLRLRLEGSPNIPKWVRGDPNRLRQILNNLFSNALKFTEHGTVTLVAVAPNGRDAPERVLKVRDTGPGMTPDQQGRLFQPFEQVGVGASAKHGGTGLGLAISRNLARLMGGDLAVESTKGEGATFVLTLQLPAGAPVVRGAEMDIQPFSTAAPLRALVVDDHVINRRALSLILEAAGCVTAVAQDGREALDILARSPFDVVLMDVNLGDIDGLETTRRLRATLGRNQDTPVLAVTGSVDANTAAACLCAGMNAMVTKPVTPKDLLRALEKVLAAEPARASAPCVSQVSGL